MGIEPTGQKTAGECFATRLENCKTGSASTQARWGGLAAGRQVLELRGTGGANPFSDLPGNNHSASGTDLQAHRGAARCST